MDIRRIADDMRARLVRVKVSEALSASPELKERLATCADEITALMREKMGLERHPATNADCLNYFRDRIGAETFNAMGENPNLDLMSFEYYKGRLTLALNAVLKTVHGWFVDAGHERVTINDIKDVWRDQLTAAMQNPDENLPDEQGYGDIGAVIAASANMPAESIASVFGAMMEMRGALGIPGESDDLCATCDDRETCPDNPVNGGAGHSDDES